MAFDPDAYLADKNAPQSTPSPKVGFDPDAYLAKDAATAAQKFDPSTARQYDNFMPDPQRLAANQERGEAEATAARIKDRHAREAFIAANAQPGVTLDLDQSLPAGIRARLSVEGNIDKQLQLLDRQPGILGTRKAKDNSTLIATIQGDDGKPRDVLLNPKSFSAADIAGNAGNIAKGIGTAIVAAGTGGLGLIPTAAAMAGTSAAMNATMEGGSRVLAGQDIDPAELAKSSLIEGGVNAALPLAGAAAKGTGRLLTAPFRAGAGALERDAVMAAERQAIPLTVAQSTGSATLARSTDLPGTGGAKLLASQQGSIGAATDRQLGLSGRSSVPSEASIAGQVKPILATELDAAQNTVTAAKNTAARAAQDQIRSDLDRGIIPSSKSNSEVGSFIREAVAGEKGKAEALRSEFSKRYPALDEMAAKEGITVDASNVTALKNDIDEKATDALLEFAPGIKKIAGIERLLTGKPTPGEVSPILDAFGRTQSAAATAAPKLTLPEVRELKNAVFDAIQTGVAPGEASVPNRYLSRLYKALNDDYDAAVATGSPELRSAEAKITKDYAEKIAPLQQSDIAKLFLKTDATGRLGDDEIVTRLFTGRGNLDALRAYKQVLGENSPEYKLLLRQGVNDMMGAPSSKGMVDAGKFLGRLNSMAPEMQTEVLGPTAKSVVGNARLMATAQGTKVPIDELEDALLSAPGSAPKLLQSAIERENAVSKQYQSGILEKLRNGTINPKTLNEDRFVSDFIPNASISDVKQVLASVASKSPEAVEALRQRTLANILDDVAAKPGIGKVTTGESRALDFSKLTKDYLTGDARDKYQSVIGQKGIQFLNDMATINEAIAKQAENTKPAPYIDVPILSALQAGLRGVRSLGEFGLGIAQRLETVRSFLATGELPSLNATSRAVVLLASPAVGKAASSILAGKSDAEENRPLTKKN